MRERKKTEKLYDFRCIYRQKKKWKWRKKIYTINENFSLLTLLDFNVLCRRSSEFLLLLSILLNLFYEISQWNYILCTRGGVDDIFGSTWTRERTFNLSTNLLMSFKFLERAFRVNHKIYWLNSGVIRLREIQSFLVRFNAGHLIAINPRN